MPNRIIKEAIRTSRDINNLSDFQFRVWAYLITYVDDYGRGSADPELLKGLVFPRRKGITEKQVEEALSVLANSGMISLYSVDGEPYFYFSAWEKHQQIRAKKSKFPSPDGASKHLQVNDIICNQMQANASKCPRNPIQSNPNTNLNTESESESESNPSAAADPALAEVVQAWDKASGRIVSLAEQEELVALLDEYGKDPMLAAIRQCTLQGVVKLSYLAAVLRGGVGSRGQRQEEEKAKAEAEIAAWLAADKEDEEAKAEAANKAWEDRHT